MFRVVPVEHAQKIDIPVLLMHSEFEKWEGGGLVFNLINKNDHILNPKSVRLPKYCTFSLFYSLL